MGLEDGYHFPTSCPYFDSCPPPHDPGVPKMVRHHNGTKKARKLRVLGISNGETMLIRPATRFEGFVPRKRRPKKKC